MRYRKADIADLDGEWRSAATAAGRLSQIPGGNSQKLRSGAMQITMNTK